jgi:hypothetical protein
MAQGRIHGRASAFSHRSRYATGWNYFPVLANLALDGLEARLKSHFGRPRYARNLEIKLKVNYVRYADDFIITGRSKELLENEVMPVVERFMLERGLTLSPTKRGLHVLIRVSIF